MEQAKAPDSRQHTSDFGWKCVVAYRHTMQYQAEERKQLILRMVDMRGYLHPNATPPCFFDFKCSGVMARIQTQKHTHPCARAREVMISSVTVHGPPSEVEGQAYSRPREAGGGQGFHGAG